MVVYTKQQILEMEKLLKIPMSFVNGNNKSRRMPRCYQFCETILKNIEICRVGNWNDIEELSKYIKCDWDEATSLHYGRYEYDFYLHEYDLNGEINTKIDQCINEINSCIYRTYNEKTEIAELVNPQIIQYDIPEVSEDILNEIYKKSIEWGENWSKPIRELIDKEALGLSELQIESTCEYIYNVRENIEIYISSVLDKCKTEIDYKNLYEWVNTYCPWMNEENVYRTVSQYIYYAIK